MEMTNKKKVLLTMVFLGISTTTCIANAYAYKETGVKLGAELSLRNKTSINGAKGFEKNKLGANFFVGARLNKEFGAELGYGFITKTKEAASNNANQIVNVTHKVRNVYIDALGYFPVNACTDIIGSVGIGRYKSKLDMPTPSSQYAAFINRANKAKLGIRVGLGAQYNFCDNWSTRAMIRYQRGNKHFLRRNVSIAIGAAYAFS